MRRLLIGCIRAYQRVLSPLKRAPTCRFVPTCSEYAAEAIAERGVVVGLLRGAWRLLRCNPLFRGGYDPVTPRRALPHDCGACPQPDRTR